MHAELRGGKIPNIPKWQRTTQRRNIAPPRIDEYDRMRHLRAFLHEATAEKNVPFHDITAAYPKNVQAHSLD